MATTTTTTTTFATVKLGSKDLCSYREGEEIYVLYSQLLHEFQLGNSTSPSTLQRKKNKVVSSDQFCARSALICLKEAGVVKKEAKKVAVLTVAQAIELLKLFEIYVPDFEQQQPEDSTPEPATATCPEDVSDWEPQEESGCLQQPPTPAPAATIWEETSLTETVDETFTEPPPCKFVKLAADQRKSVKQLELSANPTVAVEMLELKRFWTAETNHKRRCKAISHDTFTKTRERLQCECVNCSATVSYS